MNLYKYAAPANFYPLAGKLVPWFAVPAAILFVVGLYVGFFIAPTDAQARSRVRDAWPVFTDHLRPLFRRWGLEPSPDPTLGGDVDRALELGVLIAGSPATVREQLERFEAESGTDYFVGKFTTGDLSHLEVMRSLDLFATHVMDR